MSETTSEAGGPKRAPYRMRTARLEVRGYRPTDAPALQRSLADNREHLAPWMAWAIKEPQTVNEKLERILRTRGSFDRAEEFVYGIFEPETGALLGGTGLHPRCGIGAIEIGYWIEVDHCGGGYAGEVTCALTQAAFWDLDVTRVEVHCDPLNVASRGIPKRFGFHEDALLRQRYPMPDGVNRDTVVYSILRTQFDANPMRHAFLDRFDALEQKLAIPTESPSKTS